MQLGILLAVVASITISENVPHEPVTAASLRLLLTFTSGLTVIAFVGAGSLSVVRSLRQVRSRPVEPQDASRRWRAYAWFYRLFVVIWLLFVGLAFGLLNWPQLVRYNWELGQTILLADVIVLAPVWLPWLFAWAAFYDVERAIQQPTDGLATPRRRWQRRLEFVSVEARHELGLCLLPALLLLASDDLMTWWIPGWQESPYRWLAFAIPLIGLIFWFPTLLSHLWQTTDLPDGSLRRQLVKSASAIGMPCRRFRIWKTNGRLTNAAVVGFLPGQHRVFLTDGMLDHLNEEEIAAVVLHELGHVRRHHLLQRLIVLTLPLPILAAVTLAASSPALSWAGWVDGSRAATIDPWLQKLLLPAVTAAYGIVSLGWLSRRLEHDADLCVAESGRGKQLSQTLKRLSALTGEDLTKSSWLHPSTLSRMRTLDRAIEDPRFASAVHRGRDRTFRLLVAIWVGSSLIALALF
jgi:Zn-dependent protease with chaperone function